jgi:hypothetical protein
MLLAPMLSIAQTTAAPTQSPAQQPVPPGATAPVNPESAQPTPRQPAGNPANSQPAASPSTTSPSTTQTVPQATPPEQSPQATPTPAGPAVLPEAPTTTVHRPLFSTGPALEEGPMKPGIQLADPMLYGPVNCPSSLLGITNPEAAASAKALEYDTHNCIVSGTLTSDLFMKYTSTWVPYPMTPKQKLELAGHDIIDPFNILSVGGVSAIGIASNSHSVYGPGFDGFAKYFGVNMTQDITGEFVGTFLINTIAHEDPHYHRMPQATIPVRIGHALASVVVAQSDTGRPMPNYENLVGYLVEDKIASLYVPGLQSDARAEAERWSIGLATAPVGNFVTEFFPDVARRLNIRTIFVQRIINQIAHDNGDSGP